MGQAFHAASAVRHKPPWNDISSSLPEELYTIDPATGATTFVTDLSGPVSEVANQVRFIGNTAYTTSYTTPSDLYTLNLSDGAGTLIGNIGLNQNNGLGGVVNGQLVDISVVNSGDQIFSIDPATGDATPGATINGAYVFTLETPEPGSAILMGSALGFLLAVRMLTSGPSR